MKKALVTLLITIALGLGLVFGLVFFADPFYHFHRPIEKAGLYLYNEMYQDPGMARHFTYDTVMLGSSMTENFKLSFFDKYGENAVKLCYSGARSKDIGNLLNEVFKSKNNVNRIYIDINDYQLTEDSDSLYGDPPSYLYDDNILTDVQYIYNKDVLIASVDRVMEGIAHNLFHKKSKNENASVVVDMAREDASTVVDTAREDASSVMDIAEDDTSSVVDTARGDASVVLNIAEDDTSSVVDTARGDASAALNIAEDDCFNNTENAFTWTDAELFGREHVVADIESAHDKEAWVADNSTLLAGTFDLENLTQNICNITKYIEANPDTEFIIFYPPYSGAYWYDLNNQNLIEAKISMYSESIRQFMEYSNVKIYFFMDAYEIISDLDNYRDMCHFNMSINEYMIDCMHGNEYLAGDDIEQRLEALKKYAYSYDPYED